jgi:hypothetical protein
VIVDEDCGIPTSVIDNYREEYDSGPLGPLDPRTLQLSMSDYKQPQSYDVYGMCDRPRQAFVNTPEPRGRKVQVRVFHRTSCERGVGM